MSEIVADVKRIACCGLYCGACGKYLSGKCPGCAGNAKATWCKTRTCCLERGYSSCASCTEFTDLRKCPRLHNWFSTLIGMALNSNRLACLERIRATSPESFATEMAEKKAMTIPRRNAAGGGRKSR